MSARDRTRTRGLSRRSFLRSAGGAAASTAVVGVPVFVRADEPANGKRAGVRKFPAAGQTISLTVNGQSKPVTVTPATTLLAALREQCGLTGCKEVCDRGACGACTVLIDGKSVNGCLMLAVDAVGTQITTVEGLAKDGRLDPVQQAFADCDACQCGYCIPGFVVRSRALLDETPAPDSNQIRHGLAGNICRCAAYNKIFEAVEKASKGGAA